MFTCHLRSPFLRSTLARSVVFGIFALGTMLAAFIGRPARLRAGSRPGLRAGHFCLFWHGSFSPAAFPSTSRGMVCRTTQSLRGDSESRGRTGAYTTVALANAFRKTYANANAAGKVHDRGAFGIRQSGGLCQRLPGFHQPRRLQGPGRVFHPAEGQTSKYIRVEPKACGEERLERLLNRRLARLDHEARACVYVRPPPRALVNDLVSPPCDTHSRPRVRQAISESRAAHGGQAGRIEREEPHTASAIRPAHVRPAVGLGKMRNPGQGRQKRRPQIAEKEPMPIHRTYRARAPAEGAAARFPADIASGGRSDRTSTGTLPAAGPARFTDPRPPTHVRLVAPPAESAQKIHAWLQLVRPAKVVYLGLRS